MRLKVAANQLGVKVLVLISTFDSEVLNMDALSNEIATPEKRANLAQQLMQFLDQYDLDGYFLYWISPGCPQVHLIMNSTNPQFLQLI